MKKKILFLTFLLALFLRAYQIGNYPALNADEAAIGYNAYSLLETGKDEHGNPWPIHFQSFNDYKPGLYFYLSLPFVKILGLNELAIRFPGVLIGAFSIIAIYLLVKEIFKDEVIAQVSSFFLAISPWHIHFSRGAWEVNLSTFLIIFGVYFFLKARTDSKNFIYSAILFVLSLYTYHAARVVVPLLVFVLVILYFKDFKKGLKKLLIAAIIGIFLLLPLLFDLSKGSVFARAAGIGLFADTGTINRINEQRGEHNNFRSKPALILHNKAVNYTLAFLENWSEHYWGEFLFLSGDGIQRNKVPETGQMYLMDILFVVAGIVAISKNTKKWGVIIAWLVIAPSAAALTFQSPHALRGHNMVIPLVIISAGGLVYLSKHLHKRIKSKKILDFIFVIFVLIISWNFLRYLHMYYTHMSKEYPFSSQYGAKELVNYVSAVNDKYDKILVTDAYDQPYILFLFYEKYPPSVFQENHFLSVKDAYGFSTVGTFDKYVFKSIDFEEDRKKYPNSLIIGTNEEIPDEANIVNTIYFPNGLPAFQAVAN